jgi:hypothetical protein
MLFPYTYISPHTIDKFQEIIDHLVLEVWCKADKTVAYDITLLHKDLEEIIEDIFNDPKTYGKYLYEPIEEVYKIFQQLSGNEKTAIALKYRENNLIEEQCDNAGVISLTTYDDLAVYHPDLPETLKDFNKSLYYNAIKLDVVEKRIGKLEDHYDAFVKANDEGKCPYCGVNTIKGVYNSKREAYDHYLPQSTYPFISVNFKNLAPMCHECNSSYKLIKDPVNALPKKDPLRNQNGRRKAFYSYKTSPHKIDLKVTLNKKQIKDLVPRDITIELKNPKLQDEIATWNDVFGIEERYKAKCLEKNEGKYWFIQTTDEHKNAQKDLGVKFSQEKWVQYQINAAKRNPYAGGNFIKSEFIIACQNNGALPKKLDKTNFLKGICNFFKK